jgi:hypothetical protein
LPYFNQAIRFEHIGFEIGAKMKIRIKNVPLILSFLLLLAVKGIALGFDQEDIMMHGFASQGYLKSSDNNYLGYSKEGSYEYNEIGVNFMVPVTDDLQFGIQLFSRDLGKYGNNELVVDWAILDYNVSQYLGFRAGKVKMPFGMRNRSRDVDNLRIPIILNQAVYLEGLRDLIVASYGFNAYGALPLGIMGELDYDFLLGTLEIPGDSPFIQDALNRLELDMEVDIAVTHIEGGQLLWMAPLQGLTFSGTGYLATFDVQMDNDSLLEPIMAEAALKEFWVLSAKYDYRHFSAIFEYMRLYIDLDMGVHVPVKKEGWYGEFSWNVSDWLGLSAAYGKFFPDTTNKNGHGLVENYYAWQEDATFSTKFNVNEYLCLKLEVHYIEGLGLTDLSDYVEDGMKKHWLLFAFKTSINF